MKHLILVCFFLAGLLVPAAPAGSKHPAVPVPAAMVTADKLQGIWYCQQKQTVNGMVNQIGSILQLERNGSCRAAANLIITGMQMGQSTEFTGTAEASGTWRMVNDKVEITADTVKIITKSLKMNGQKVKEPLVLQGFQSMLDQQSAKIRGQKRTVIIQEYRITSVRVNLGETTVVLTRKPRQ